MLAKVSREEKKDLALTYGSLTGLVWGIVISLHAFRSPQSFEWADWCALLVGGIVAGFIPFACVQAADWLDGRSATRRRGQDSPA